MLPFLLALVLGFKHSFDADHILAVSTMLTRSRSVKHSIKMSMSWALGHMITAGIIAIILFYFKETFFSEFLSSFELIIGVMLIFLGLMAFNDVRRMQYHRHKHRHDYGRHAHIHAHSKEGKQHYHKHMFGIGIIHGLASNDEILILLTALFSFTSIFVLLLGIAIFSIGVVLGMVLYATIFSYPLLSSRRESFKKIISIGSGGLSILYGIFMLSSLWIFTA